MVISGVWWCDPSSLTVDINSGKTECQVENHTVLFYHGDSEEMYVGGTDFVLKLDVDDYHNREVRFFFLLLAYIILNKYIYF